MKNQVSVNNVNLEIVKEKVANLSDADMNLIVGGDEAAASTRTHLTCSWCTSTTSIEDNA